MRYEDRAKLNELNCQHGALMLFYSLAEHGLLKEPHRSWASGLEPDDKNDPEYVKFHDAMIDVAGSIIMFHDEIRDEGKIPQ